MTVCIYILYIIYIYMCITIYILHYNYICIIISHYHITIYRCVCARAFFTSFLFWRRGSWPSWGAYGSPKQLWRASWTCPAPTCRAWSCIYLGKREGCTMRWVEPTCCNMLQLSARNTRAAQFQHVSIVQYRKPVCHAQICTPLIRMLWSPFWPWTKWLTKWSKVQ